MTETVYVIIIQGILELSDRNVTNRKYEIRIDFRTQISRGTLFSKKVTFEGSKLRSSNATREVLEVPLH